MQKLLTFFSKINISVSDINFVKAFNEFALNELVKLTIL